jgi:hypothetical protein
MARASKMTRTIFSTVATAADMPNVDLRIMPLDRDIALGAGSFVIMSFGSRSAAETASLGDVVSTESLNTELYVEGRPIRTSTDCSSKPWSKLRCPERTRET